MSRSRRHPRSLGAAALLAGAVAAGYVYLSPAQAPGDIPPVVSSSSTTTNVLVEVTGSALQALNELAVKGRAPKTGYDRSQFGAEWSDDVTVQGGKNGCDGRQDVLRRDLVDLVVKPGTQGCVPLTGSLVDPFTGETLPFVRGTDSASQIHIDHVASLSNIWQTGAQQLDAEQRRNVANDPFNLWAVSGTQNMVKGDGDAATWLPPNKPIRCDYVAAQVAVKAKYGLWVTEPEPEAMRRVLRTCPDQPLPTEAMMSTPDLIN